jgi:hypothetical protein
MASPPSRLYERDRRQGERRGKMRGTMPKTDTILVINAGSGNIK